MVFYWTHPNFLIVSSPCLVLLFFLRITLGSLSFHFHWSLHITDNVCKPRCLWFRIQELRQFRATSNVSYAFISQRVLPISFHCPFATFPRLLKKYFKLLGHDDFSSSKCTFQTVLTWPKTRVLHIGSCEKRAQDPRPFVLPKWRPLQTSPRPQNDHFSVLSRLESISSKPLLC